MRAPAASVFVLQWLDVKAITYAGYTLNGPRSLTIETEFGAKASDEDVQVFIFIPAQRAPDPLQQVGMSKDLSPSSWRR